MLILVASALLITPGVLTDVVGFLCLMPGFRGLVKRELVRRVRRAVEEGRLQVAVHPVVNVTPPPADEEHR